MTGLRKQLNSWIEKDGFVSFNDIRKFCEEGWNGRIYKVSTAERRLRQSESPMIEAVYSEKGYIQGYHFRKKQEQLNIF